MEHGQTLKVMSYNIHYGIGRDKKYDIHRIIEVIKRERPDVVALQEVDNHLSRTGYENQSKMIADALNMEYFHCVNRRIMGGEFGITTLTRYRVLENSRHELTYKSHFEPRGSLQTDINVNNNSNLHVFNVHLGLNTRERQYQRERLLSHSILLADKLRDPIIVMGDFNDRPISVVHSKLRHYFTDVFQSTGKVDGGTLHWGPLKIRLDYIYISHQLKLVDAYVLKDSLSALASDHFPLVAIVKV